VSVTATRPLQSAEEPPGAKKERSHSGRLLLRMPETLHAALARAADGDGVSLNQFITTTLAQVVGEGRPAQRASGETVNERSRWLSILLVINLVVVAAAGILAIVLLVSSWRG